MKKTINTLCVIIILLVIGSALEPTYKMCSDFTAGVKGAISVAENNKTCVLDTCVPYSVLFEPTAEQMLNPKDTVVCSNSEALYVNHGLDIVYLPDSQVSTSFITISCVIGIVVIVLCILLLICFIRFIININKNRIFETENSLKLRRIGIYLLAIALLQITNGIVNECFISTLSINVPGYVTHALWSLPWGNTIFGFASLLLSLVWKKAILLRDENALTI